MYKKSVAIQGVQLSRPAYQNWSEYMDNCRKCKNDLFSRYGGINSLLIIQDFRKLRNSIREKGIGKYLENTYNVPNKVWVMLLQDVCANLKSSWSTTSRNIKSRVRDNENMKDEEKSYIYYILSVPKLWYSVLKNQKVVCNSKKYKEILKKIDPKRIKSLNNFIKRNTRKYKFKVPHTTELNCISYDETLYVVDKKNNIIKLTTNFTKNKRFECELKSRYCYREKGNIQLILNRKKKCLEIHKLIECKHRKNRKKTKLGVDIGYHTFLSCSNDKEYGIALGERISKEVERLEQYNLNRNFYISQKAEICKELKKIKRQINSNKLLITPELKAHINKLEQKAEHITKHHTGNKKYKKQHKKYQSTIEKLLNSAVLQMFEESQPSCIVREELSFDKNKIKIDKKSKGETEQNYQKRKQKAKFQSKMNNWINGKIDERIDYMATVYNVPVETVNPAYTSQYCSVCHCKTERYGSHHEKCKCLNCGELNANTNAAKNILQRLDMKNITVYTNYKTVKKILEEEYNYKSS